MTTIKSATCQWVSLLALTGLTFWLAEHGLPGFAAITPVLLITLFKGRIVIDRFMALQGVAGPWRWIVLGWLAVVLGLIGFTFRT